MLYILKTNTKNKHYETLSHNFPRAPIKINPFWLTTRAISLMGKPFLICGRYININICISKINKIPLLDGNYKYYKY